MTVCPATGEHRRAAARVRPDRAESRSRPRPPRRPDPCEPQVPDGGGIIVFSPLSRTASRAGMLISRSVTAACSRLAMAAQTAIAWMDKKAMPGG